MTHASLSTYGNDGASAQARAVLALVQDIDPGLNPGQEADVHRWVNGRERGYTISLYSYLPGSRTQRNIVFYEHRSSDHIEIHTLDLNTYGQPLTLQNPDTLQAWARDAVLQHRVGYGNISECANVIHELISAWCSNA